MDFPTFVMGENHCFMVKERVNVVQKALRAYGGSFNLVTQEDYDSTPQQNRQEFNSLQEFLQFLQQTHKTDQQRGYNIPNQFNNSKQVQMPDEIERREINRRRNMPSDRRGGFDRRQNDRQ